MTKAERQVLTHLKFLIADGLETAEIRMNVSGLLSEISAERRGDMRNQISAMLAACKKLCLELEADWEGKEKKGND